MTNETLTVGRLNSDLGKHYAGTLNRAALLQIADWCAAAERSLSDGVRPLAEQLDAGLYQDAACALRALAAHAA